MEEREDSLYKALQWVRDELVSDINEILNNHSVIVDTHKFEVNKGIEFMIFTRLAMNFHLPSSHKFPP